MSASPMRQQWLKYGCLASWQRGGSTRAAASATTTAVTPIHGRRRPRRKQASEEAPPTMGSSTCSSWWPTFCLSTLGSPVGAPRCVRLMAIARVGHGQVRRLQALPDQEECRAGPFRRCCLLPGWDRRTGRRRGVVRGCGSPRDSCSSKHTRKPMASNKSSQNVQSILQYTGPEFRFFATARCKTA